MLMVSELLVRREASARRMLSNHSLNRIGEEKLAMIDYVI